MHQAPLAFEAWPPASGSWCCDFPTVTGCLSSGPFSQNKPFLSKFTLVRDFFFLNLSNRKGNQDCIWPCPAWFQTTHKGNPRVGTMLGMGLVLYVTVVCPIYAVAFTPTQGTFFKPHSHCCKVLTEVANPNSSFHSLGGYLSSFQFEDSTKRHVLPLFPFWASQLGLLTTNFPS